jgi:DNA repair exonuclease SbcCD ATPase subunit
MPGPEDADAIARLRAETAKVEAEAAKLRAETEALARAPWKQPSIYIPLLLAIAGGTGGLTAGYFDWKIRTSEFAKQELELQRRILTLRQEQLELASMLRSERAALEEQTAALRVEAQRLAQEVAAAKAALDSLGAAWEEAAASLAEIGSRVETTTAALDRARYTVFLHFRGALSREVMRNLQQQLVTRGYRVPGIERIDLNFGNDIRYFHADDSGAAEEIAGIVREAFGGGCTLRQPLATRSMNLPAPRGNIEVWIGSTTGQCT